MEILTSLAGHSRFTCRHTHMHMCACVYICTYICICVFTCSRFSVRQPRPPNGIPPHPPCFKSANSHGDRAPWGGHPRDCRRFGCLKAAIFVTGVSFDSSHIRYVSKVPTVTGIRVVLIAVLTIVIAFETSYCCRILDVFSHRDWLRPHLTSGFYKPGPSVNLLQVFYELL